MARRPKTSPQLSLPKFVRRPLTRAPSRLEQRFDATFATRLALKEKQIQQNYRPVIGIHKWFARRPGSVFRSLLLSEFGALPLNESYWHGHQLRGLIADPFMGGGTPVYEANRLGFDVIGCDVNPMACWIVSQSLSALNHDTFKREAAAVLDDVAQATSRFYRTRCLHCDGQADVKYFLWVKTIECPSCDRETDLFPGRMLAEAVRHPRTVTACSSCGELNETTGVPRDTEPAACVSCGGAVYVDGNVKRQRATCTHCTHTFPLPKSWSAPPRHRLWAIEYYCSRCYDSRPGRLFKTPDASDLKAYVAAKKKLKATAGTLPIPDNAIPTGDETNRLLRWGYRRYRDMFNERQLLTLGTLLSRIKKVADARAREALLTVFSDTLRYQNMLCRYDTYALKCQDIFSVHGFPVGLVQCENSALGLDSIGSGGFRHFVEKYLRAKQYCAAPFETNGSGPRGKNLIPTPGETIEADLVDTIPIPAESRRKRAWIVCSSSETLALQPRTLDGVFTDPPYFDNVQYAELMDFCYSWLRLGVEHHHFLPTSTRNERELTGNETLGRGLEHFTDGLSRVFTRCAASLKPGRPFVFTYHHNDARAYVPLVVAILDADLTCTATLPVAGEMSASLHIAGTASSTLDTVFVCRDRANAIPLGRGTIPECRESLRRDAAAMIEAGVRLSEGDLRCLLAGHVARIAMGQAAESWSKSLALPARMALAEDVLCKLAAEVDSAGVLRETVAAFARLGGRRQA